MFLHSREKSLERGGLVEEKFYLRSRVSGTGFDTRQPRSRRSRSRRDYGDFSKYQLKYLPIDYGIIMHRMVRVDYRRAKRKKKKKNKAKFFHTSLAHGRRSGRSTWSVHVQVHRTYGSTVGASPQEHPVSWKGLVKVYRCVYALRPLSV